MADINDTVAKLLRKAEGTDNEAEAQTFYAKAQALITRHALDELEIRAAMGDEGQRPEEPVEQEFIEVGAGCYFVADCTLWTVVANANTCKVLVSKRYKNRRTGVVDPGGVYLIGRASDRTNVKLLMASLNLTVAKNTRTLPDHLKGAKVWDKEVWRRSFRESFANVIGRRLVESRTQAAEERSLLPALIDQNARVDDYVAETFGQVRESRSRTKTDGHGWSAGADAARRADVGGVRVGQGSAGSLGRG
jgi:hypothetical protein